MAGEVLRAITNLKFCPVGTASEGLIATDDFFSRANSLFSIYVIDHSQGGFNSRTATHTTSRPLSKRELIGNESSLAGRILAVTYHPQGWSGQEHRVFALLEPQEVKEIDEWATKYNQAVENIRQAEEARRRFNLS